MDRYDLEHATVSGTASAIGHVVGALVIVRGMRDVLDPQVAQAIALENKRPLIDLLDP